MKKVLQFSLFFLASIIVINGYAQGKECLKSRLLAEGIYIRNLGNFGNVWSESAGGYIGYGIAFPEHSMLIFRTGFINSAIKDGIDYTDSYFNTIPLELGGRYYFVDSLFMPFVQFMNGFNIIFENTNLEGEKKDRVLFKYAWQIGVGITVNLLDDVNLDFGVNYQSNFYEKDAMNTGIEYVCGVGLAL